MKLPFLFYFLLSASPGFAQAPTDRTPLWTDPAPIGDGATEDSPEANAYITIHRPTQANGTAIVICPGGGYGGLVVGGEGHGIAKWLNQHAITGEELRKRHAEHFQKMDEHIRELNQKYGRTVMYVAPAPQALIALRENIIAGEAPGLKVQEDLFTDELGHGKPPLMALVGYVNYATIYRRSPIGLPVPAILKQAKLGGDEEPLNRLLQELAWNAVLEHPLSGVKP